MSPDIIGNTIKIGVEFLGTFASDMIDWLNGDGVGKLVEVGFTIGKSIVEGILKGIAQFGNDLFGMIFGDEWEATKKRTEQNLEIAQKIEEEGSVKGKSGREYTNMGEVYTYTSDANHSQREFELEFGFRDETALEQYQKIFWEAMGTPGSMYAGRNGQAEGDSTMTPEQFIAKAFGINYNSEFGMFTANGVTKNLLDFSDAGISIMNLLSEVQNSSGITDFMTNITALANAFSTAGFDIDLDNIQELLEQAQETANENPVTIPVEYELPEMPETNTGTVPSGLPGNPLLVSGSSGMSDTSYANGKTVAQSGKDASKGLTDAGNAGKSAAAGLDQIPSAASGVASALTTLISEFLNFKLPTYGGGDGDGDGPNSALGGRFGSKQQRTLGEDGAEYIIPVTKGQRGVDLTIQAMSEMGSNAVRAILNHFGFGEGGDNGAGTTAGIMGAARGMADRMERDFGIGTHGSLGSSADAIASALSNIQPVNNYTITAPVNINVSSSGADAQDIGNGVYSAAERHLVRTLRGVVS